MSSLRQRTLWRVMLLLLLMVRMQLSDELVVLDHLTADRVPPITILIGRWRQTGHRRRRWSRDVAGHRQRSGMHLHVYGRGRSAGVMSPDQPAQARRGEEPKRQW